MGSNWIEIGLRAVYLVAITRYLGAELYGVWAYAVAAYGFVVALTGFGFETLVPIRLGADKRSGARIVGLTLSLRLGLLGVGAAGFASYALQVEPSTTARLTLLLMIPALCGSGLALWAKTVFLGFERVGAYVKVAAATRLAEVGCGIALLAAGSGLLAIVALHSLAWMVEAAIGLFMVRRRLTPYRPHLNLDQAAELLRQGAVLGLTASLTGWLMFGPLLLLRHVENDLTTLGQFGLALQFVVILIASIQPFLVTALPVLSRSDAGEDPRVASYGAMTALVALVISIAASGLGFTLGPAITERVFGSTFALAGELLGPCLLIGGLILAPTGYQHVLIVRGRRWPGAAASGIGGLFLLVILLPAVESWGVHGAVYATAGAWLVRAAVLFGASVSLPKKRKGIG